LCKSGQVSITVLDVLEISWGGLGNGYTADGKCNSFLLDKTAYHKTAGILNYRAFVDSETPTSLPRNEVTFRAKFTTTPVKPMPIYIKSLDADDPLPNAVASNSIAISQGLDPNDASPFFGFYAGQTSTLGFSGGWYNWENDNRGDVVFAGLYRSSNTIKVKSLGLRIFETTISSFKSEVYEGFFLNNRPGDNFFVGIFPDLDFVKGLRNVDQTDELAIVYSSSKCTGTNGCFKINDGIRSPLITSWRTLHVEFDRMRPALSMADNLPHDCFIKKFYNSGFTYPARLSAVAYFDVIHNHEDFTLNGKDRTKINSSYFGKLGRFSDGTLKIGDPISATKAVIEGNSKDKVGLKSVTDLTTDRTGAKTLLCYLTDASGIMVQSFTIDDISIANSSADYQVDIINPGGVNLSLFSKIKFSNWGTAHTIITPISNTRFTFPGATTLNIPVTIFDDDADPTVGLPKTYNLNNDAKNAYAEAFLNIVNDGGGDLSNNKTFMFSRQLFPPTTVNLTLPIIQNFIQTTAFYAHESLNNQTNDFWIAYCFDIWERVTDSDFDDDSEKATKPIAESAVGTLKNTSDTHLVIGMDYSVSYIEHQRENGVASEEENIAHEIGHQFGLGHGTDPITHACISSTPCPNMGIMSAAASNKFFIPLHLNLLRLREPSPGQ
jgi:hypothetical protein